MLEIRDLDAFYGDAQALWGVTMDVHDGETVAVLGTNGAGKSTLVNAVAGLHAKRRGRVAVGGVDIAHLPAHRVCEHGVAVVPEGRRVFPAMSVYDNLCLGAYRRTARAGYRRGLDRVYGIFPGCASAPGSSPAASAAASSRCWRSAGRSWPSPRCCCSTSRRWGWRR
ncbi:hypothetical protein Psuf_075780 [Phytohabitans suffuscus]|uniref:ABC transporter domain-containing protein n=1 Tax=Phytohabitans suffuscus TaxID=624315 RepID=A0A6F8YVR4_9ACTN|nr:ATP-binding cassette domain-containing protein [Phytohabitans suffuscus]BCB90265.1 hypothetical protein Psuf_075780 [Phytohabitans suffuscus]